MSAHVSMDCFRKLTTGISLGNHGPSGTCTYYSHVGSIEATEDARSVVVVLVEDTILTQLAGNPAHAAIQ